MKTIYLVSRAKTTGPINQGLNILNGMKLNGHVDSTFVTLAPEDHQYSWLQRYKDSGIKIMQFNLPLWLSFMAIPKLHQYVKKNNIDVIHACGFRAVFVALMANTSAKLIITQRCNPDEIVEKFPKIIQPFFNSFYLWMIKQVDVIVACSKSIQRIMKKKYNIYAECVQNGVDTNFFKPLNTEKRDLMRKKLGLPLDKKIYLILGSLRDRKNNSLIVDAFKKIRTYNMMAVFVGSGPEEAALKERALESGNIIFVGFSKEPICYLQSADILISASLAEGLPNTVLEALSCGIPCILSDIEPHKEIIEKTNAGVLFKSNKVEELSRCIIESSKWQLDEKKAIARKVAIENFGIRSLAQKYEKIYRDVRHG